MEHHGVSQEDWEQSQTPDYRVDPLNPPAWVVRHPPGQHLAMLEGAPVDEWRAEPNITVDELLRQPTTLAESTSQACSYHSQESYFLNIQVVKETIQRYEDEQGLQYHEKPVHLDSAITGPITATIIHLQRELCAAGNAWQEAEDRAVDAQVHRREAENEVAQLKWDLFGSQDATRVAQENARKHEKAYHETLMLLRRVQSEDPAATSQADRALIQSLEARLNDASQQLQQLRAKRAPNAADGQMAVQQSQTNEQLETLRADNAKLHTAIEQLAGERDRMWQANVQLQLQSLNEKTTLDTDSNALRVRCLQAEAEVVELKGEIDMMKQRSGYRGNLITTSAALGPLSFPALGGLGGGLTTQASPQLGGGIS